MRNGEAYAVLATGAKAAICEADVSCSALTVEDSGSAYTYLDQATEALTQAGFDASSVVASRRRLSGGGSRLRALSHSHCHPVENSPPPPSKPPPPSNPEPEPEPEPSPSPSPSPSFDSLVGDR